MKRSLFFRRLGQWAGRDVWRFWLVVACAAVPLPIVQQLHEPKAGYIAVSTALQIAGAVMAFCGIAGTLREFSQRYSNVAPVGTRFTRWWGRAPWKPQPPGNVGAAAAGTAALTASGSAHVTTQGMPADQRIDIIEGALNNLNTAVAALYPRLSGLEEELKRKVEAAALVARQDAEHTVQVLTGSADDQILGIALLAVGGIFGSLAEYLATWLAFMTIAVSAQQVPPGAAAPLSVGPAIDAGMRSSLMLDAGGSDGAHVDSSGKTR
jgi:hypothetical protein